MNNNIPRPYGFSTMVTLGLVYQLYVVTDYVILFMIWITFGLDFLRLGPIFIICILFGPFIVIYETNLLIKLKNKNVQGVYMAKKILPVCLIFSILVFIEGFIRDGYYQIYAGFIGIFLNSFILIYWNDSQHIQYLKQKVKF